MANWKIRGEAHHLAKLTESDVRLIREAYASGGISQRALASKFEVAPRAIAQVIHRESWSHVR
jgi:ribosome-binding protein aMBF1 (putative translation factor)